MSQIPQPGDEGQTFRLLFVCTGNTCRSPLAAAIARREARERGWDHLHVRSAGTAAIPGAPASVGALRAADRHGLDLADHHSVSLDAPLAEWADLILVMSDHHTDWVRHEGAAADKVALLRSFASEGQESGSIADPVGGDDQRYEETFLELEDLVVRALSRIEPLLVP